MVKNLSADKVAQERRLQVEFGGFNPCSRRDFILDAPHVRSVLHGWFSSLDGPIPVSVFDLVMYSDWDWFVTGGALNLSNFILILLFLETNRAPADIRRLFWVWILPIPTFDRLGMVSIDHPYVIFYWYAVRVDAEFLVAAGGCFDVARGSNILVFSESTLWQTWNVWNCRGWSENPHIDLDLFV